MSHWKLAVCVLMLGCNATSATDTDVQDEGGTLDAGHPPVTSDGGSGIQDGSAAGQADARAAAPDGAASASDAGGFGGFGPNFPGYAASETSGQAWYVDAQATSGGSGTVDSPFAAVSSAHDVAGPGDVIYLKGTFHYSGGGDLVTITKSGAPGKPITYTQWPGETATLKVDLTVSSSTSGHAGWQAIHVNGASWIVIDGLTLVGANADDGMGLALGQAVHDYYVANRGQTNTIDWDWISSTNTNGISIDKGTLNPTHVTVKNCNISQFAGMGLAASQGDYVLFDHNVAYDNSWFTIYATSGIGVSTGYNSDTFTGYKSIINANVSYGNETRIQWADAGLYSDGNGIICDVNMAGIANTGLSQAVTYNGKTLVINNLSFANGGSGIHSVSATNIDFINNTTYKNATRSAYETAYANMFTCAGSTNNRFVDNIIYADDGKPINADCSDCSGITYEHNVYFNGTPAVTGAADLVSDPVFVGTFTGDPSTTWIDGFKTNAASSPTVGAGVRLDGVDVPNDLWGTSRTAPIALDIGAYQTP